MDVGCRVAWIDGNFQNGVSVEEYDESLEGMKANARSARKGVSYISKNFIVIFNSRVKDFGVLVRLINRMRN